MQDITSTPLTSVKNYTLDTFRKDLSDTMGTVCGDMGRLLQQTYGEAQITQFDEAGISRFRAVLEVNCEKIKDSSQVIDQKTTEVFQKAMLQLHPIIASQSVFSYFIQVLGTETLEKATESVALNLVTDLVQDYQTQDTAIIDQYLA